MRGNAMEERKRRCSVAAETPPPLLGLVSVAVLPPSGFCAPAEELEGRKDGCIAAFVLCRSAAVNWSSPLSCCTTSKPLRRRSSLHCHCSTPSSYPLSPGVYDFDSDDELQWLIEIQKISIFNFAVYLLLFFSKSLIKQSRNRINVIRRKRNSAKKFLKQDTIDLLANHLQVHSIFCSSNALWIPCHNKEGINLASFLSENKANSLGRDGERMRVAEAGETVLVGLPPFNAEHPQTIFDNILNRKIPWPAVPEEMSPEAQDLIDRLLTEDPNQRLGARGASEDNNED
ncbi:hypothetical protein Ahy_A08g038957 isoform C [Arachis hypogaea]|nr:hypothetical protein Ahy_A08g038957 isoform C [Arachis hypogaea]